MLRQAEEAEQRMLVLEYERFRHEAARRSFDELNEEQKRSLRKEKMEVLALQGRLERIPSSAREQEVDELILNDFVRIKHPRLRNGTCGSEPSRRCCRSEMTSDGGSRLDDPQPRISV